MDKHWIDWIYDNAWTIEIVLFLLLLLILNVVLKKILSPSRGEAKEEDWRAHLDYAALAPARVLLWILLGAFLFDIVIREMGLQGSFVFIPPLRNAAIILCLAWFLLRWKKIVHKTVISRRIKHHKSVDPLSLEMMGRLFTITVVFISILVVMTLFGLDVAPLLTFGGIGAAALGFASKDVIANFFGGMMLSLTRPFDVGDFIELKDKNITGHIEEIGWCFTSIRDVLKKPIYLPNSLFSTEPLINQSRKTHSFLQESIPIRYTDLSKLTPIIKEIKHHLEHCSSIDRDQPIYVFLQDFADSSVKIEIKAYFFSTLYEEYMQMRQDILLKIYQIIEKNGAVMPLPAMDIHVNQQ